MVENKPLFENDKPIDDFTYEQALNQLEYIVETLETSEHSLDDAISLFDRGQAIARHCSKLLEQAELKVKNIIENEIVDDPKTD